jgi:glutathione peroxidase
MIKLIIFLSTLCCFKADIYQLHFKDTNGNIVGLDSFKGKKILIVNTASNSKYAPQYGSLEQLYEKYKDSLVIIAFPSNDFGMEPGSDSAIASYVSKQLGIQFFLAAKISVSGSDIDPVYSWLTDATQNGVLSNPVPDNFFKFLINGNGMIIGIFGSTIDPMSDQIQQAVAN